MKKLMLAAVTALILACAFGSAPARAGGVTVDHPMSLDGTDSCLEPGVPTQIGASVHVATCSGSPTQLWWHNGNELEWSLGGTNLCVDAGPSQSAGQLVFLNTCTNSFVQQWAADPVPPGSAVRIWMVGFGWCLQPRPDNLVAVYPCAQVAGQHWVGP